MMYQTTHRQYLCGNWLVFGNTFKNKLKRTKPQTVIDF